MKTRNKKLEKINKGDIYPTNQNGDVEILKYNNCDSVIVKFLDTGTIKESQAAHVRSGILKDPFKPVVFGVGFVGSSDSSSFSSVKDKLAYQKWYGMITRCYSEEYQSRHPTYKGCTVCEEWHNFQNFAKWFYDNHPEDGKGFHLDKDIKVDGNKIYGPDGCMIVTMQENIEKATSKEYTLLSPSGEKIRVHNLSKFCKENGLEVRNLCSISNKNTSKGWKIIKKH